MDTIIDIILQQAILALVGYGLVGWSAFRGLLNAFALREFRLGIDIASRQVQAKLTDPSGLPVPWEDICHPAAKVLARLDGVSSVSERELTRIVDQELDRCFSPLLNAVEMNQTQAQFFGLCGTLTGYPLAAEQFRQSRDVVTAFSAISMAIWTTVIGTVVAQWEDSHARSLQTLRQRTAFDTWAFLEDYLRARGTVPELPKETSSSAPTASEPPPCAEASTLAPA